jgi:hypothetical protein
MVQSKDIKFKFKMDIGVIIEDSVCKEVNNLEICLNRTVKNLIWNDIWQLVGNNIWGSLDNTVDGSVYHPIDNSYF